MFSPWHIMCLHTPLSHRHLPSMPFPFGCCPESTSQHNSLKVVPCCTVPTFSTVILFLCATHPGCHSHPQILVIKVPTDHLLLFQHLIWQNTSSSFLEQCSPGFCDAVCYGHSSSSCWLSLSCHTSKSWVFLHWTLCYPL